MEFRIGVRGVKDRREERDTQTATLMNMATPGNGININRNAVIVVLVFVAGAILFYQLRWGSSYLGSLFYRGPFSKQIVDVTKLPEAPKATDHDLLEFVAERINIELDIIGRKTTVYSLQMKPKSSPKGLVLLLHGLGDSSHNWVQVNTLHLLAFWGYRAVAIDLPGYGHSQNWGLGDTSQEKFMEVLVGTLGGGKPIIVAPSMSGSFAIPYLFVSAGAGPARAKGFVAVAPTASEIFVDIYPQSQLPTLILYGETDIHLGEFSREKLQTLPRSNIVKIPKAGHACFKEQPELFHRALYHFLRFLEH